MAKQESGSQNQSAAGGTVVEARLSGVDAVNAGSYSPPAGQ